MTSPPRSAASRSITEVCSACHTMNQMHYRDLAGIGISEAQIKAIAAGVTVPQGIERPRRG